MNRLHAIAAGLSLIGAAGVLALSAASPGAVAGWTSWADRGGASRPGYQVRLELPQALRPATNGPKPSLVGGLEERADPIENAATLAPADRPQTLSARAATATSTRSGLLDVTFDIATFGKVAPASAGRDIRTSKALNHNGKRVGSIELALGQGSVVSVDRRGLQSLVGEDEKVTAALAGMEGEMVSFDALRDRGIRIRYDPLADTVMIDGDS